MLLIIQRIYVALFRLSRVLKRKETRCVCVSREIEILNHDEKLDRLDNHRIRLVCMEMNQHHCENGSESKFSHEDK